MDIFIIHGLVCNLVLSNRDVIILSAKTDSDLISAAFNLASQAEDPIKRSQLLDMFTNGNIGGMNLLSGSKKDFEKELASLMSSSLAIDKQDEINAQQVNSLVIKVLDSISLGATQLGSIITDGANSVVNAIQSGSQNSPTSNASTVERGTP